MNLSKSRLLSLGIFSVFVIMMLLILEDTSEKLLIMEEAKMNKEKVIEAATKVVHANVEVSADEMTEADKKTIQAAVEIIEVEVNIASMTEDNIDEIPENYQVILGAALMIRLEEEYPEQHDDIIVKGGSEASALLSQLSIPGKGELQLRLIVFAKNSNATTVMEKFFKVDQYERVRSDYPSANIFDENLSYANNVGDRSVTIETYPLIEEPAALYLSIDLVGVDEKRLDELIHFIGQQWTLFSTERIFIEKDNDGRNDTFPVWEIVQNKGVYEKGQLSTLTLGE